MNDIAIYNANQRKIALLSEDKVKKNFVFIGVFNFSSSFAQISTDFKRKYARYVVTFIEIVQNNYGLCPVSVTILPRFLSNVLYK